MENLKAVGLLSGGLDSTLAAKILIDMGITVHAINFVSPFCTCTPKSMGCSAVIKAVEQLGNIPLKRVSMGDDYLAMIKTPKHGYGRGMNPCIDCRIMKIKKAADYMRKIGAAFLFTGEVLGQRPMSQHRKAIDIIDEDSDLAGYILRPLSAAHFNPTIAEEQGLVDRSKLLNLTGRTRKPQMALAKEKNITDYPCPNGGCLLTDERFAVKLSDYFARRTELSVTEMAILKTGRYLKKQDGSMVFVARDEREGLAMEQITPLWLNRFTPVNFPGPVIAAESLFDPEIAGFFHTYSKLSSNQPNQISCDEKGTVTIRTI